MPITENTFIASTNVVTNGCVQILRQTQVMRDDQVIGTSNHRNTLEPGQDFQPFVDESLAAGVPQDQVDRVCRNAVAAWDEEIVAEYHGAALANYQAMLAQAQEKFNAQISQMQSACDNYASEVAELKNKIVGLTQINF